MNNGYCISVNAVPCSSNYTEDITPLLLIEIHLYFKYLSYSTVHVKSIQIMFNNKITVLKSIYLPSDISHTDVAEL